MESCFLCWPRSHRIYSIVPVDIYEGDRVDLVFLRSRYEISMLSSASTLWLNALSPDSFTDCFMQILVYLCGACIYAAQVPEKYYPGCFDWIGGSHNIWHACVLGGILFHWHAMHDLFHVALMMATKQS